MMNTEAAWDAGDEDPEYRALLNAGVPVGVALAPVDAARLARSQDE